MNELYLEKLNEFFNKSILHEFSIFGVDNSKTKLFVKRDDLMHNEFSGNKLRKLKFNFKAHSDNNCDGILTFGGAFSNHLLATASACHYLNIPCVGIVRGDELNESSNSLLKRCHELGMNLLFYSRSEFTKIKKNSGRFCLQGKEYWAVPEGGANQEGILGCREIVPKLDFDYVIVAQGTTTTSLGILLELTDTQKIIVVPVLKGFDSLLEMQNLLANNQLFENLKDKIIALDQFHFGGYGKTNSELNEFVEMFNEMNDFVIEPIYTGKVIYALSRWLNSNGINENKKVLFVHTGGLFAFQT
ncbi:MAG: pyridoxal-phosphate dependent enzyme [Bacteroidetes bacterium]|nr:pyridoxal-phosphate dependent enzyme [Bacteroidota bacterium]